MIYLKSSDWPMDYGINTTRCVTMVDIMNIIASIRIVMLGLGDHLVQHHSHIGSFSRFSFL